MECNPAIEGRSWIPTEDKMGQNYVASEVVLFILNLFIWLPYYFASMQIVMSE